MEAIAVPTDFLGVNTYTRAVVRAGTVDKTGGLPVEVAQSGEHTDIGWEVYSEGMYELLNRLYFGYGATKLYITENGCAYSDGPDAAGVINDEKRIAYLRAYLTAAHRAIQNGVPLAGYFVWSLMDNFEWAKGYSQRFGIVWVDYETQQRIPKASARWFQDAIAANAITA
jgi:beta-glucosidase